MLAGTEETIRSGCGCLSWALDDRGSCPSGPPAAREQRRRAPVARGSLLGANECVRQGTQPG